LNDELALSKGVEWGSDFLVFYSILMLYSMFPKGDKKEDKNKESNTSS